MRELQRPSPCLVGAIALIGAATAHGGGVRFVDDDAPAAGDGLTWTTAYRFLQDALADAAGAGGTISEIRVAHGVYRPDRSEGSPGGTGNRLMPFALIQDVAVRGGYLGLAAGGGRDPGDRDLASGASVLSGDLLGDDEPGFVNDAENSYHVVFCNGDPGAVLDGFVISGGNADGPTSAGRGAGMFNGGNQPEVSNCRFIGNAAVDQGGGLYADELEPVHLVNCAFSGNTAGNRGGAVYVDESFSTLRNCTVSGNTAGDQGGGLFFFDVARGICPYDYTVYNCVLWGNGDAGGADESAQLTSVTNGPCPPEGPVASGTGDLMIYTCIEGWTGGGEGNTGEDPLFIDADGVDDTIGTLDDDLRLGAGSPCIDAGSNSEVSGSTSTDLLGQPRFFDDPATRDTGQGTPPIVDLGAYEFQGITPEPCPEDLDLSGDVAFADLLLLLGAWGPCPPPPDCPEDLDETGDVGFGDLLLLLGAWGPCP